MQGTIVSVKVDRRFGFIEADGGNQRHGDVFFHEGDLSPELVLDEQLRERRVVFDIETSPRGPRAVNIKPAD